MARQPTKAEKEYFELGRKAARYPTFENRQKLEKLAKKLPEDSPLLQVQKPGRSFWSR